MVYVLIEVPVEGEVRERGGEVGYGAIKGFAKREVGES